MKKGIVKAILALMLVTVIAFSIVSCGAPDDETAISLVKDLVEKSYELNEIYFGQGLKYRDSGNPNDIYMPVLETEKYILKTRLLEKTREVFSESLSYSIIDMAFNGVASEINQNSVQSRYMVMSDDDLLYVNKNYEPVVDKVARFDYTSVVLTKVSGRFIVANIKTVDGEKISVTLVNERNGWRLDSYTC